MICIVRLRHITSIAITISSCNAIIITFSIIITGGFTFSIIIITDGITSSFTFLNIFFFVKITDCPDALFR